MIKILNLKYLVPVLLWVLLSGTGYSQQQGLSLSLATVDVQALTKRSLFDFQVSVPVGAGSRTVILKGVLTYRNTPHRIAYTLTVPVRPGINNIADYADRARFEYSSSSVKELFEVWDKLPEGIVQYCVTISGADGETSPGVIEDCVFGRKEDIFLINLVDPEDKARLYELNPMLSWVVNYPFTSGLSYKIRVVEMKKGQNAVNAVKRNNPVYEEKGLMQMSVNYPVYARPLEVGHTYAWTVDAYYKDLLLGGAEVWQFTIVEDSLLKAVPKDISYYDFARHQGETRIFAVDTLKLKYQSFRMEDTLHCSFTAENGKAVFETDYPCSPGTNLVGLFLRASDKFRHGKLYTVRIRTGQSGTYVVPFIFIKSEFIK